MTSSGTPLQSSPLTAADNQVAGPGASGLSRHGDDELATATATVTITPVSTPPVRTRAVTCPGTPPEAFLPSSSQVPAACF